MTQANSDQWKNTRVLEKGRGGVVPKRSCARSGKVAQGPQALRVKLASIPRRRHSPWATRGDPQAEALPGNGHTAIFLIGTLRHDRQIPANPKRRPPLSGEQSRPTRKRISTMFKIL